LSKAGGGIDQQQLSTDQQQLSFTFAANLQSQVEELTSSSLVSPLKAGGGTDQQQLRFHLQRQVEELTSSS
jgi:hypothetical protein